MLVIYVFIYDFIVVGEDGLIYEFVEYLVFFCVILGFIVICLFDVNEIVSVWVYVF